MHEETILKTERQAQKLIAGVQNEAHHLCSP